MKASFNFNGVEKKVDFTKPQYEIFRKLMEGKKATYINTHRMNGGDFVWFEEDGNYWGCQYVGYKAFNGVMRAIEKTFNLDRNQVNQLYDMFII